MRIDDAAIAYMKARPGMKLIWSGDFGDCHDIAEMAGCHHGHPLNIIAKVMREISKSPKFRLSGYIEHEGRDYPVFRIVEGA